MCISCNRGFVLATGGASCEPITCLSGQYYDPWTETCVCNYGTFLSGGQCVECDGITCRACNSGGCTWCRNRYYLSGGFCLPCPDNCRRCTNGIYCRRCKRGYSKFEGICYPSSPSFSSAVFSNSRRMLVSDDSFNHTQGSLRLLQSNRQAVCPAGCSECAAGQNNKLVCNALYDGFAIHNGVIKRCTNAACKTCAPSDLGQCISCYKGYFFSNGVCTACEDANAETC